MTGRPIPCSISHGWQNISVVACSKEDNRVRAYDLAADAWAEGVLDDPPNAGGVKFPEWNAFYDPERNAHFSHVAMDGQPNGAVWAYRYKAATGASASPPSLRG